MAQAGFVHHNQCKWPSSSYIDITVIRAPWALLSYQYIKFMYEMTLTNTEIILTFFFSKWSNLPLKRHVPMLTKTRRSWSSSYEPLRNCTLCKAVKMPSLSLCSFLANKKNTMMTHHDSALFEFSKKKVTSSRFSFFFRQRRNKIGFQIKKLKMLDFFSIFTKGGLVLWYFQGGGS